MELLLLVAICAIVILSVACRILWTRLARIEAEAQAQEAELSNLENMDTDQLVGMLLDRLPTLPKHKRTIIKSFVKDHKVKHWYDRSVHCD